MNLDIVKVLLRQGLYTVTDLPIGDTCPELWLRLGCILGEVSNNLLGVGNRYNYLPCTLYPVLPLDHTVTLKFCHIWTIGNTQS